METDERDISQRIEARLYAAKKIHRALLDEIGEEKFRRLAGLLDRVHEFVKHEYATHIMTHLVAIIANNYTESVFLNISECNKDEELEELFDTRPIIDREGNIIESIQRGKIEGINMVLKNLSGEFPLKYYQKRDMDRFGIEGEVDNWGINYLFPTSLDGVNVCYFYPDKEVFLDEDINPESKQIPTISFRIDPIVI